MKLQLVGCSHHGSAVALRERLAFNPTQLDDVLWQLRQRFPQTEIVVLSTCNRVEVYTAAEEPTLVPTHQDVSTFLAEFHGLDLGAVFDELFERTGEDMVRHLFTVAASLDSMVVGEPQILAQVKHAYQLAQRHQSAGPLTHEVFQAALRVAKRVATETSITQHRVSIASAAIDLAHEIFDRFEDKEILVIGAGEMADDTLRYLRDAGARRIRIINRTQKRAAELAQTWHGQAESWDKLDSLLVTADLIVSTTSATKPIVPLLRYRRIEQQRYQRPLFILDLGVPRNFEPAIGECLGVYLYSLDDLGAACRRNREARDQELPAALAIIEQETQRFMSNLSHRVTRPIIQRLKRDWQQTKDDELQRLFGRVSSLDERTRSVIEQAFDRYANKLLHPPLASLRAESRYGPPYGLLDALKRLFQLGD